METTIKYYNAQGCNFDNTEYDCVLTFDKALEFIAERFECSVDQLMAWDDENCKEVEINSINEYGDSYNIHKFNVGTDKYIHASNGDANNPKTYYTFDEIVESISDEELAEEDFKTKEELAKFYIESGEVVELGDKVRDETQYAVIDTVKG